MKHFLKYIWICRFSIYSLINGFLMIYTILHIFLAHSNTVLWLAASYVFTDATISNGLRFTRELTNYQVDRMLAKARVKAEAVRQMGWVK